MQCWRLGLTVGSYWTCSYLTEYQSRPQKFKILTKICHFENSQKSLFFFHFFHFVMDITSVLDLQNPMFFAQKNATTIYYLLIYFDPLEKWDIIVIHPKTSISIHSFENNFFQKFVKMAHDTTFSSTNFGWLKKNTWWERPPTKNLGPHFTDKKVLILIQKC